MRLRFLDFSASQHRSDPDAPENGDTDTKADRLDETDQADATEHRFALLIGNSRYPDGNFRNPVNDARGLAWALKGIGFRTTVLENADLMAMQTAVVAFAEALDAAGPETVAFVYFAGHGIQHNGHNYLVPAYARIPSSRYLPALSMSTDLIFDELSRCSRRASIVVVDACRISAVADGPPGPERLMDGLVRRALPRPAQIVYAASAGMGAEDGTRNNSPFAEALIEEIPSLLIPGRRIQDAFDDAAARVTLLTEGRQTPAMYREGILPPLTLSPEDEERLKLWSKRPKQWTAKQIAVRVLGAVLLAGLIAAGLVWHLAYPETRTAWLIKAGLKDPAAYDVTCVAPWDGPKDRYGLTRRDWCLKIGGGGGAATALDLDPQIWDREVAPALAEGDPKAVVLMAMRAVLEVLNPQSSNEAAVERARQLADRAANTDVPLGKVLPLVARGAAAGPAMTLSKLDLNFATFASQIRWASDHGLLWARIATVQLDGSLYDPPPEIERRADVIEAILAEADRDDPTGQVAFFGHDLFGGRGAFSRALRDKVREDAWLARAVGKNWPPAADQYLYLDRRRSIALAPKLRERLIDAVTAAGGPSADYWTAMRMIERGSGDGGDEALLRLERAAKAGHVLATEALADRYLSRNPADAERIKSGIALLEDAATRGSNFARVRLGLLLLDGLQGAQGEVLVPPDLVEGRRLLELADADGDIRATGYLADAFRFGPLALRDLAAARQLYVKVATALPLPELSRHARREIETIDRAMFLNIGSESFDDPTIGSPSAPVEVIIYLTPSCLDCEVMVNDSLRELTRTYLSTKQARFVLRLVAATGQADDLDATVLAQCIARDGRYTFITRLIEHQSEWSGLSDIPLRDRSFERLIALMPLAIPSPQACLANADSRKAVLARQEMAERFMKPVIGRRPIAFVNGRLVEEVTVKMLDEAIRASLSQPFAGIHKP
jgi:Caspase domain/Thioredoxin